MATSPADKYRIQLGRMQNKWENNVARPYNLAYMDAYAAYTKKFADQAEADKARAELVILCASVVTGSVLMASAGSLAVGAMARTAVRDATLDFICTRNLERTFTVLAIANKAATSRAGTFAIGKLVDEVKSKTKDAINDAVQKMMRSAPIPESDDPAHVANYVDQFIGVSRECAEQSADAIEGNRSMSEAERAKALDTLRQAAFFNPPPMLSDHDGLVRKIELALYMNAVLQSDYLVDVPAKLMTREETGFESVGYKRTAISQRPGAKDYPNPRGPQMPSRLVQPGYQYVEVKSFGSDVRARIDELHRKEIGGPFYHPSHWYSVDPATDNREMLKAQDVLDKLAVKTRPLSFGDLRGM